MNLALIGIYIRFLEGGKRQFVCRLQQLHGVHENDVLFLVHFYILLNSFCLSIEHVQIRTGADLIIN